MRIFKEELVGQFKPYRIHIDVTSKEDEQDLKDFLECARYHAQAYSLADSRLHGEMIRQILKIFKTMGLVR